LVFKARTFGDLCMMKATQKFLRGLLHVSNTDRIPFPQKP